MTKPAEAYERLLYDAMLGDHTLFLRDDTVLRAWTVVQPALDDPPPLCFYPGGTWGPPEADRLVGARRWALR
jgi:glucose-6-phosphate 1-dehydrogenase